MPLGLTPAIDILNWLPSIGVLAGVFRGFHTSPLSLSLASHVPDLSSTTPEKGIQLLVGGKALKGAWYETFITHPHAENFWSELESILTSLEPGKYCILLRPQFEHGGHKSLGTSFLTDNQPNMTALREHFEPIIVAQEDE